MDPGEVRDRHPHVGVRGQPWASEIGQAFFDRHVQRVGRGSSGLRAVEARIQGVVGRVVHLAGSGP